MRALCCAAALLLTACGSAIDASDKVSVSGQGVDAKEVARIIGVFRAHSEHPEIEAPLDLAIAFEQSTFPCGQNECMGATYALASPMGMRVAMIDSYAHYFAEVRLPTGDLYKTALIHELMHVWFDDMQHARNDLWCGLRGDVEKCEGDSLGMQITKQASAGAFDMDAERQTALRAIGL